MDSALKVSEALGRTRKKKPRAEKEGSWPKDQPEHYIKVSWAGAPRAGTKDFPAMCPGGSDSGGLSSLVRSREEGL